MSPAIRESISQHRGLLATLVVFSIIMPVSAALIPLFAGQALDGSRLAIALLVAAAAFRFVTNAIRRYTSGSLSLKVQHDLRMNVFSSLQTATTPAVSNIRTGQVVSRTISDLSQIQGMLAMFPAMSSAMIEAIVILAIMYWLSWPLAIILTVQIPILAAIAFFSRRKLYDATWNAQQQAADIASQVEETVTGVRVVKAFAQEPREVAFFKRQASLLYRMRVLVGKLTAIFQPALAAVPNVVLVGTVVLGGWLALNGTITIGEFLTAASYVTLLSRMTRMAAGMLVHVHLATAAVSRVQDLMNLPHRDFGTEPAPAGPLGIQGHFTALDGSVHKIDVEPGSTVFITGAAGSGKTVLAQALAGQDSQRAADFRYTTGEQKTPSVSLANCEPEDLPTIVFEEPFLYSTSLAENIRLGSNASDAEVWAAAEAAEATEFIDKLGGLETIVGERGLSLSGGQRQRIALARAILRSPRVLILDGATSAIDALTEKKILSNLAERTGQDTITTIMISHRLTEKQMQRRRRIDLPDPPHNELWPADSENSYPPAAHDDLPEPTTQHEEDLAELTAATANPVAGRNVLTFRKLVRLVPWPIIAVIITLLVGLVADIVLPTLVRTAIDDGVAKQDFPFVLRLALFALAIVLISWASSAWNTVLTTKLGERLLYALRVRSFSHVQSLSMHWYERTSSGRIMTRMTTDIDNLSNFLQTGLSQAIVSTTMLIGVLGMLVWTDPVLSGVAAIFLPIIAVAAWYFRNITRRLYKKARAQISTVNAEFQESVNGLTTGIAYNYTRALTGALQTESQRYVRLREKGQAAVSLFFPGMSLITELAQALVLLIGTARIASGDTSPGTLVAFSLYLTFFFGPVQQLSQIFDQFQQAKVSVDRISDLLTEPAEFSGEVARSNASPTAELASDDQVVSVDFRDVHFSYDATGPESLTGTTISFSGTTALVGPTGSGKSTIAKLISRWYDPSTGQVVAVAKSGRSADLRQLDVPTWRRTVGVVPQEAHLFRGTVASNIAYGKPEASADDVEQAVRAIGGEEILASIPGGFLGSVRERGEGLSAAQKQIISLARAELVDPDVMVLDEATANLNEVVEQSVVSAVTRATSHRAAIVIAHRLSTAEQADRVAVVDNGAIAAIGTHEQLLQRGEQYAKLWSASQDQH